MELMDILFTSVLDTSTEYAVSAFSSMGFVYCAIASLVLGLACALIYMFKHKYSKNFVVTLALLPIMVQIVILLVNGNIGAGVAVMGVFNLVRFRSIPGTAKDIGFVFLAMAIGLATGMGYIGLAVILTMLVGIMNAIYLVTPLGELSGGDRKQLKITVPEDLEFEGMFDEVIGKYTSESELVKVETSNMGSLYKISYLIQMREAGLEKAMIDELRCLNGNLKISLGLTPANKDVL